MKDEQPDRKVQVEEPEQPEGDQLMASGATGVSPQIEENREKVISDLFNELRRAEQKFPGFPDDPIHAAAIVAEENGELQQAVLQWTYEGGIKDSVYEEAIQTAAMALRFLFHFDRLQPQPSDQVEKGFAG